MPKINLNLNPFKKDKKPDSFIVIDIGLEIISAAVSTKTENGISIKGIGKKSFIKQEEVFDGVIEAIDALVEEVHDIPQKGLMGISGGSLETITTVAKYRRQKPKQEISAKETEDILNDIAHKTDNENDKKIFFSTVAGAKIDNIKFSNPLGLKGENVELSCFVALKNSKEMETLDRLMGEIDIKIEKIVPSSYALVSFNEEKKWDNTLLLRVGENKSELTTIISGHISEITPVGLGIQSEGFFDLSWQNAITKSKELGFPKNIWVFPDNDKVDLSKAKELLDSYDWDGKLNLKIPPEIKLSHEEENVSSSEISIRALAEIGL